MKLYLYIVFIIAFIKLNGFGQSATDIITKMESNAFGGKICSRMKMTIERPKWNRTMEMKSWSDGNDFSLILVTAPSREKGIAYLKREKEMWNFQPSIDRIIKMPPSMMMQSWMGSDFKNDDLVRQTSITEDYNSRLLTKEMINGVECFKIELIPNESATVVWGKVILWIDSEHYLNLKTEHYDEDEELVDVISAENVKKIDGRWMATKMILKPNDGKGKRTILEYLDIDFDVEIEDAFFSTKTMKNIR